LINSRIKGYEVKIVGEIKRHFDVVAEAEKIEKIKEWVRHYINRYP